MFSFALHASRFRLSALCLTAGCSLALAGGAAGQTPQPLSPSISKPNAIGVAYGGTTWPRVKGVATVYYVINAASDPAATPKIKTAIAKFNSDFPGVLQWVPWTAAQGRDYVDINLDASDLSGQCEALEGYEAVAAQKMWGSTACTVGTILHEMGHIIGLWHEQSRPDHAAYIQIDYGNVIKGSWGNFLPQPDNSQNLTLYDYASLMQYPPYAFTRNGGPVIETIPAGMPLGGVEGVPVPAVVDYSAADKEAILRLYGAPPTSVTVTSNPIGLLVLVDGVSVKTPKTYTWALHSTHTLNVAAGVQTLTGNIADSTTSAKFFYTYGRWNDSTAQSHTITVAPGNGELAFPATAPQVATYSASFIQLVPYTAAVYPAASGKVSVSPTPQPYPGSSRVFFTARQSVTLTATAAAGWGLYEFNNAPFWLPGGLGQNPKTFFVPDSGNPVATTVEFSNQPVYTVKVTPEHSASNFHFYADGNFAYSPKNYSSPYDPAWTPGSTHVLSLDTTQSPYSLNSRYTFDGWSDGGAITHTIRLPASAGSYAATVTPEFRPVTNFSDPPCGGAAAMIPNSPTSDGFYPAGHQLQVHATPDPGWSFAGWSYDLAGSTNPTNVTPADESLVFANFNIAAAPLTLSSLTPSSATSGSEPVTLTLAGTGFAPGSLVSFNGIYRAVTYLSSTKLTVPLTAADLAVPGNYQVFVENFPKGWTGCAVFGYQPFFVAK